MAEPPIPPIQSPPPPTAPMPQPPRPTVPALDERLELVGPAALAARVGETVAAGARLVTLVGLDDRARSGGFAVEVVLDLPGEPLIRLRANLPAELPHYPAITPIVPAAQWDERELKDLLGIVPEGHPDARRLVLHERFPRGFHPLRKEVPAAVRPEWADRRFIPFEAHGEGLFQLPVGPIHAGIIEPGHFRFSAVGESVLHLEARLFFTHRGLEKLVEGRPFAAALPIVERACGVCTVTHALAFSDAVERLTGTGPPPRARWARTLLAELERLYNHVGDLGNLCAGTGLNIGVSQLGWLKERLLRLNETVTGHRYLTGVVGPGGLRSDLDVDGLAALPAALAMVEAEFRELIRLAERTETFMERMTGTGVVTIETAGVLGAAGVTARASGLALDLRVDRPGRATDYGRLGVEPTVEQGGDVLARWRVRVREALVSIDLLRQLLARPVGGEIVVPLGDVPGEGASALGAHEGPRGASWIWLAAHADGTVERLHLRSASFANWPVVASAVPGNLVPDFPLINKSFELCYACTDR